jgi:hypothetical protein
MPSAAPHPFLSTSSITMRANSTDSLMVKTTLGLRLMGAPRRRITAMIDAAMTRMPFSRFAKD